MHDGNTLPAQAKVHQRQISALTLRTTVSTAGLCIGVEDAADHLTDTAKCHSILESEAPWTIRLPTSAICTIETIG